MGAGLERKFVNFICFNTICSRMASRNFEIVKIIFLIKNKNTSQKQYDT